MGIACFAFCSLLFFCFIPLHIHLFPFYNSTKDLFLLSYTLGSYGAEIASLCGVQVPGSGYCCACY